VRLQCRKDFGRKAADQLQEHLVWQHAAIEADPHVVAPALSAAPMIRVATVPTSLSQEVGAALGAQAGETRLR
jgi:hypothetical protein